MIDRDIFDLTVWVYARQRAHVMADRADLRHERWLAGGMDSVVRFESQSTLGVRVDGGGPVSSAVDDEALAVHRVARAVLAPGAWSIMLESALAESPPDHMADVVSRPVAVIGRNGKPERWPVAIEDGRGGVRWEAPPELHRWTARRSGEVKYAPASRIRFDPDPATIAMARDSWRFWHETMVDLRVALTNSKTLAKFRPTGPDPVRFPRAPWDIAAEKSANRNPESLRFASGI